MIVERQFSNLSPTFATLDIHIDHLDDQTSWLNLGQSTTKLILRPELAYNEFSSWSDYPEQFKFISVHLAVDQHITHVNRRTYDLLDMMVDVGGLVSAFYRSFVFLVLQFSEIRINTIITGSLFYLS
jgi:hypothetical protein